MSRSEARLRCHRGAPRGHNPWRCCCLDKCVGPVVKKYVPSQHESSNVLSVAVYFCINIVNLAGASKCSASTAFVHRARKTISWRNDRKQADDNGAPLVGTCILVGNCSSGDVRSTFFLLLLLLFPSSTSCDLTCPARPSQYEPVRQLRGWTAAVQGSQDLRQQWRIGMGRGGNLPALQPRRQRTRKITLSPRCCAVECADLASGGYRQVLGSSLARALQLQKRP